MSERIPWVLAIALLANSVFAGEARAELLAHWKFEADAPFDDAVSRFHLSPESSENRRGSVPLKVSAGKPAQVKKGKDSLQVPPLQPMDLRLRVNAPTSGGNPFRLSGRSWTLSGWCMHTGEKPTAFGQVIAGTHGYSTREGRGNAGWCLRVVGADEGKHKLAAIFSTGGEKPVGFEVAAAEVIETGEGKWNHFGLVWEHDGGASGAGAARLFLNGKLAGEAEPPGNFDKAAADRNAFRGIWIAGRPTSKRGGGSDNWAGRLDEVKFFTETAADAAMLLAEIEPEKPKPKPEPVPKPVATVATVDPKMPVEPAAPPPPPKPKEKILEVRTWTDLRGTAMEAAMVVALEAPEGRVLLQTEDGIRFSLPLERLSEGDRGYVGGQ